MHIASCAAVYLAVGLAVRRVLRTRPGAARIVTRVSGAARIVTRVSGAARIVTRVSGAAMIVIATVLLVEQLLHLHG